MSNKAEYEMKEKGLSYNHYGDYDNMSKEQKDDVFNKKGLTPVLPTGSSDKVESTTKSAVAEGIITIKDKENQKQDIGELNRNMTNNLNKLGEIFDKDDVKERQELAGLFMQEAMGQLHYWNPDSAEGKALKAMAHGIVGEIAARIAGNQAGSGFYATMTNEALIGEIHKIATKDPALAQWISAVIGGAVNKAIDHGSSAGSTGAIGGTKWNLEARDTDNVYIVIYDPAWRRGEYTFGHTAYSIGNEHDGYTVVGFGPSSLTDFIIGPEYGDTLNPDFAGLGNLHIQGAITEEYYDSISEIQHARIYAVKLSEDETGTLIDAINTYQGSMERKRISYYEPDYSNPYWRYSLIGNNCNNWVMRILNQVLPSLDERRKNIDFKEFVPGKQGDNLDEENTLITKRIRQ